MRRDAAVDPPRRALRRLGKARRRVCDRRDDVVEGHEDVGAELVLDRDGGLGREQHGGAVDGRLERDALLRDLREVQERHHLEAACTRAGC